MMNLYQLASKADDTTFLKGEMVKCSFVLKWVESESEILKPNDKIVIKLTTGSKYLGKILKVESKKVGEHNVGCFEIIRSGKP